MQIELPDTVSSITITLDDGHDTTIKIVQSSYILRSPLGRVLDICPNTQSRLEKNGIETVAQLIEHTAGSLLHIRSFGDKQLAEVTEALAVHGLALAPSAPSLSERLADDYMEALVYAEESAL